MAGYGCVTKNVNKAEIRSLINRLTKLDVIMDVRDKNDEETRQKVKVAFKEFKRNTADMTYSYLDDLLEQLYEEYMNGNAWWEGFKALKMRVLYWYDLRGPLLVFYKLGIWTKFFEIKDIFGWTFGDYEKFLSRGIKKGVPMFSLSFTWYIDRKYEYMNVKITDKNTKKVGILDAYSMNFLICTVFNGKLIEHDDYYFRTQQQWIKYGFLNALNEKSMVTIGQNSGPQTETTSERVVIDTSIPYRGPIEVNRTIEEKTKLVASLDSKTVSNEQTAVTIGQNDGPQIETTSAEVVTDTSISYQGTIAVNQTAEEKTEPIIEPPVMNIAPVIQNGNNLVVSERDFHGDKPNKFDRGDKVFIITLDTKQKFKSKAEAKREFFKNTIKWRQIEKSKTMQFISGIQYIKKIGKFYVCVMVYR